MLTMTRTTETWKTTTTTAISFTCRSGRPFFLNTDHLKEIPKMRLSRCGLGWRKPAEAISDRGARYRANSPGCRPLRPRICIFCGGTRNVEVHHLDGHEENTDPRNLVWADRPCNTIIGIVLKRAGLGRRTRQFNPGAEGARSLRQWVTAVLSMKGEGPMEPSGAVEMIQATPPDQRSRFAQQIWRLRRSHGTDRMRTANPLTQNGTIRRKALFVLLGK